MNNILFNSVSQHFIHSCLQNDWTFQDQYWSLIHLFKLIYNQFTCENIFKGAAEDENLNFIVNLSLCLSPDSGLSGSGRQEAVVEGL